MTFTSTRQYLKLMPVYVHRLDVEMLKVHNSAKRQLLTKSKTTATKPSTVQTVNISDSDDSDFEAQPKPKKKSGSQSSRAAISTIRSDIQQMRKDIQLLYKIDRHTRIPQ